MEKHGTQRTGRVVLVPCPFQGHITPMLQVGTILHSKGFSITVVHTMLNSPDPSNHPDFVFLPMPDNLSVDNLFPANFIDFVKTINTTCEVPFRRCLTQIIEKQEQYEQVVCVVYDALMFFSADAANHMKLPTIILRTSGASATLAYHCIARLQSEGYIPFPDSMLQDLVPGLHPLRFEDLPISKYVALEDAIQMIAVTLNIRTSSGIIWNTTDFLEHSALAQLKQHSQVPFFPIGPFHKMAPASSTSLIKEDTDCISWLDMQAPRSVIYVSMGSLATMDENELGETAWGLANSGQPFLWVIRPGSVHGSEWIEHLPEGFKESIGERAHIVKWAPQRKVLAHGAVGGFWSHCGWNSTWESICEGVPMICRPYYGDQKVNVRYLSQVWKIGLELEHALERGQIERAIRRLLVGKEREKMRIRARNMRDKVKLCMEKGGSSYNSLNELTQFILSFCSPK